MFNFLESGSGFILRFFESGKSCTMGFISGDGLIISFLASSNEFITFLTHDGLGSIDHFLEPVQEDVPGMPG